MDFPAFTTELEKEIMAAEERLMEEKKKLAELRQKLPKTEVSDYTFRDKEGREIKLSDLFRGQSELMLVHNMGKSCVYCTLWADEMNGVIHHLENRVPFVIVSPDEPAVMKAFAESRGWRMKIFSSAGNTFKKDMGFEDDRKRVLPGVSVFTRDESGKIYHTNKAVFGPGDAYCAVWSYFDLLPEGAAKWGPKYAY
ncbi:MAG: DUF899 family protein [Bacteroidota bacterium]